MSAIPLSRFTVYAKAQAVDAVTKNPVGGFGIWEIEGEVINPEPYFFENRAMLEMRIRQLIEAKLLFKMTRRLGGTVSDAVLHRTDWQLDIVYNYQEVITS